MLFQTKKYNCKPTDCKEDIQAILNYFLDKPTIIKERYHALKLIQSVPLQHIINLINQSISPEFGEQKAKMIRYMEKRYKLYGNYLQEIEKKIAEKKSEQENPVDKQKLNVTLPPIPDQNKRLHETISVNITAPNPNNNDPEFDPQHRDKRQTRM